MDRFSSLAVSPNRVLAYYDDKGEAKNVIADDLSLASNWPKFAGWLKTTAKAAASAEDPPQETITIRVGDFGKIGPEVWPKLLASGSFSGVRDELSRVLNQRLSDKATLNLIAAFDDVMRLAREDDALADRPAHLVMRLPQDTVDKLLGSALYGEVDLYEPSEVEANVADPNQMAMAEPRSKKNLASDLPEYESPRIDLLVKDPAKYHALAKVAARPADYRHLSPSLQNDGDVALASFRRDGLLLKFAPAAIRSQPEAVLVAVNEDPRAYQYSLGAARVYPPVMIAALNDPANLPLVKPLLAQSPPEVAVAYLKAGGDFSDLPKKQQNKEMVERVVREHGYALANAVLNAQQRATLLDPFVAAHPEFKAPAHLEKISRSDPAHLDQLLATVDGRETVLGWLKSSDLSAEERDALLNSAIAIRPTLVYELEGLRSSAALALAKLDPAALKDFDYSVVDLSTFDRDNLSAAEVDFKQRAIGALADRLEHNQLTGARDVRAFANLDVLLELRRRGKSGPLIDQIAQAPKEGRPDFKRGLAASGVWYLNKYRSEEEVPDAVVVGINDGVPGAYLHDPAALAEVVSNASWRAHAVLDLQDSDGAIAAQLVRAQADLYDKLSPTLRALPEVLKALTESSGSFDYSLVPAEAVAKDQVLAKRVHAGLAMVWKADSWSELKNPDVMADPSVWLATDSDDPLLKEIAALPPTELAQLRNDVQAAKIYYFERFHSLATLRRVLNDTLGPVDGRPTVQIIANRYDQMHAFRTDDYDSVPAGYRLVYREAATVPQVLSMIAAMRDELPLPAGLVLAAHGLLPTGLSFGPGDDGGLRPEDLEALRGLHLVQPGGFVAAAACDTADKLDGFAQRGAEVFPEQSFYASSSVATTFRLMNGDGKPGPRVTLGSFNDFTHSLDEHGLWVSPPKPGKPEPLPLANIKGLDAKSPAPRWLVAPEAVDRSRMSATDWAKWQRLTVDPSAKAVFTSEQKLALETIVGSKLSDEEAANAAALAPADTSPDEFLSFIKEGLAKMGDAERQATLNELIKEIKVPRGNDVASLAAITLTAPERLSEAAATAFDHAANAYEKTRPDLVSWLKQFDLFSPGAKEATELQQTLFAIDLAANQLKIAPPNQVQAAAVRLTNLLTVAAKKSSRLSDPATPLRLRELSLEHFPVYQAYVAARTFLFVVGRGDAKMMQEVATLDQDIEAIGAGKPNWANLADHVEHAQGILGLDLAMAAQKQPLLASVLPGLKAVQVELAKGFHRGSISVDVLEDFNRDMAGLADPSVTQDPAAMREALANIAAGYVAWLLTPTNGPQNELESNTASAPKVDGLSVLQRARRVLGEELFALAAQALAEAAAEASRVP